MDQEQQKLAEELLFAEEKKPSFAKLLYFGIFDSSALFPYPELDTDGKDRTDAFLARLTPFLEDKVDGDAIDRNQQIPDEVITGMSEMGLFGMTVGEEHGGLGLTQNAYCKTIEEISRRCGSTALFVNVQQSIGLKSILLFGTPEQKEKYLVKLAKGELLAAFSLTEPNAGSDASGVETRAVYDPEKKVYRINGRKQWTTNGSIADVLTVMARTEIKTDKGVQDKITAFLVTPDMKGFKVLNPALEKVGMRGTKTANLAFEDMEVPEENVLGKPGQGLKIALTVLDYGRTTFGASCTGSAKELYERAVKHATERHQFKRPLASFTLVKEKIAKMAALCYAMDATTYLTAGLIDRDQEDIMLESAMLKVFASDSQWQILYDTMQILGGRSFFTDQPYERMMRDARLNMIGEGSNEVMRAFIAAVGMRDVGMQLKGVVDAAKNPFSNFPALWGYTKKYAKRLCAPHVPVRSRHLRKEGQKLGKLIRRFGLAIPSVLAKYREEVVEHQLVLNRISTAAMALFTCSATLSKIDSALSKVDDNPQALGNDLAIAKMYCTMAFETVESSLSTLHKNNDDQIEQLADQITGIKR